MTCKCGSPNTKTIDIVKDGEVVMTGHICERCYDEALKESERLREQFDALIAAGVSREEANARMIAKIEGRGARA